MARQQLSVSLCHGAYFLSLCSTSMSLYMALITFIFKIYIESDDALHTLFKSLKLDESVLATNDDSGFMVCLKKSQCLFVSSSLSLILRSYFYTVTLCVTTCATIRNCSTFLCYVYVFTVG